jgi:hypothetical protein
MKYINDAEKKSEFGDNGEDENKTLDMTIRIMDKLAEMKVLTEDQSADLDFTIQDAIQEVLDHCHHIQMVKTKRKIESFKQTSTTKGESR